MEYLFLGLSLVVVIIGIAAGFFALGRRRSRHLSQMIDRTNEPVERPGSSVDGNTPE